MEHVEMKYSLEYKLQIETTFPIRIMNRLKDNGQNVHPYLHTFEWILHLGKEGTSNHGATGRSLRFTLNRARIILFVYRFSLDLRLEIAFYKVVKQIEFSMF